MRQRGHDDEHEGNHERWLLTYSDMITLLLVLFIVMYTMSTLNTAKFKVMAENLGEAFGGTTELSQVGMPPARDIDDFTWASFQIQYLGTKGIIFGTSDKTFSPSVCITRADFLLLIVRTLKLTDAATSDFTDVNVVIDSNFDDVTESDYFYHAVGIAKKLGLVYGRGGNNFSPRAEITRQEVFVLIARAMRYAGLLKTAGGDDDLEVFSDTVDIAGYARSDIAALTKAQIVKGHDGRVLPQENMTRAEAAVITYEFYSKIYGTEAAEQEAGAETEGAQEAAAK